jgi:hypothetical protein
VSIDSSSPFAEAIVSVCTRGASSPTSGIGSSPGGTTFTCEGAASMPPSAWVTVSTDHSPGVENLTSAA